MHAHFWAIAATMFTGAALAVSSQVATVTIESSENGSDLKNKTVQIPLSSVYADTDALSAVSNLYLTAAQGVPLDTVTCTPFKFDNGTGIVGHAFDSTAPVQLGTSSAMRLGSIVCITSSLSLAPPTLGGSSSSSSAASMVTSTTSSPSESTPAARITRTAVKTSAKTSPTSTPTQSAQKTNSGNRLLSSSEFFSGLALAGLALAFAL